MIALLSGTIAHKEPDMVILDVNGVGYRVVIPYSTWFDLPSEGERSTLHIHTHVTDGGITLYGFRSIIEKKLFSLLITVSGIGPKLARDILSNIEPDDLAKALASANAGRLSSIPGIGKKTAERLILELREKIQKMDTSHSTVEKTPPATDTGIREDVMSALLNLGYRDATVRRALDSLDITAATSMEDLLKMALKRLSS
jgi:Holliday junction DNA helicase RuvA